MNPGCNLPPPELRERARRSGSGRTDREREIDPDEPCRVRRACYASPMRPSAEISRRTFLGMAGAALASGAEPVIDIHQHTNYSGRTDDELLAHQRTMGISKTVLLPAGRLYGLAAGAGGNQSVVSFAHAHQGYVYFANELPDIPETRTEIERYLKMGAIGIGEQKFHVDCD